MPVIIPLSITLTVGVGAASWLLFGLPGLIWATYGLVEFCQGLFVRCIEYYDFIKIMLLWSGASLMAAGFVYGAVKGVEDLINAKRYIKRLPLCGKGPVVLIRDGRSRAAFTHGLLRPRIYISTGLINGLSREELRAVLRHELHHKRRFDPLRFFLLSYLKDTFFYIPVVKYSIDRIRVRKEHEADDAAAPSLKEGLSLAGALVKVAAFNNGDRGFSTAMYITGDNTPEVTARVGRLIEGKKADFRPPAARTVLLSILTSLFLGLTLSMPLHAWAVSKECSTKHCEMHINKLGKDCKLHCEASARRGHHRH